MGLLRQRYAVVTDQSWELARAAYVGGLSARAVCKRFGMGEHSLRKRAREEGWTKRAYAAAQAANGGAPPLAAPEPVAEPPAAAPEPWGELRAGRGGEATALLKATREYVLVHMDVADAHEAVADQVRIWDEAQPARAVELTEVMMLQALHCFLGKLSPGEQAERCDPDGKAGFAAWLGKAAPEAMAARRKRRR